MRLLPAIAPLGLVAALVAVPAQAYTPESGIWWNPAESGSGYVIEIQDDFMALGYYGGDAQGRSTWWTAAGFLTGNALFDRKGLDRTVGSQCIGCSYAGFPQVLAGDGGTVTVRFDPNDNTKASLTWGDGRTVQIQRQLFYFKRPEDAATLPVQATLMLGEWQMVMDFSSNSGVGFAYYGDVIVFDKTVFDTADNRWEFQGCRADTSIVGRCSTSARANHLATGFYDAASGLHVIDVVDTPQNNVRYVIDTSTNSGLGEITVYPRNSNPANFDAYPMRSFRSASRRFVQTGSGPAKAESDAGGVSMGLSDQLIAAGLVLEAKSDPVSRFNHALLSGDAEAVAPQEQSESSAD